MTALLMVVILDTTMTFTMTSVFIGWTSEFIQRFVGARLIGFAVASMARKNSIPKY